MKNNGFTLIELLAVIIILAIIITITVVSIGSILDNSKESLSKDQKKIIEDSAKIYYLQEGMDNNVNCVNLSELINGGYIESREVLDPKTKETLTGSVLITYDANQYTYEYQEQLCESE